MCPFISDKWIESPESEISGSVSSSSNILEPDAIALCN